MPIAEREAFERSGIDEVRNLNKEAPSSVEQNQKLLGIRITEGIYNANLISSSQAIRKDGYLQSPEAQVRFMAQVIDDVVQEKHKFTENSFYRDTIDKVPFFVGYTEVMEWDSRPVLYIENYMSFYNNQALSITLNANNIKHLVQLRQALKNSTFESHSN